MRNAFLLLISLLLICTFTYAQAPIERRPPAAPMLDPDWERFAERWNAHPGVEVRVQGWGRPVLCHLDFVSNDDLECVAYGRGSWLWREPDLHYVIPKKDVRDVRLTSRAASVLIGVAAGLGIGAIAAPRNGGVILATGVLCAPIAGSIGYAFPLRGRTIFRAR